MIGRRIRGFALACHAPPTVAVTVVVTAFAWLVGWHGWPLVGVGVAVLLGQLSVGWSNDALDADVDARAGRSEKPAVRGDVSARTLWRAALVALLASAVVSWSVAGWVGGSFHVAAVLMAWAYNLRLARTTWSWLPYAVAFGALPPFLTIGLDGSAPPAWMVPAFAITATAAHLSNALPDIERDRAAGLGGLAVRLGPRATIVLCWVLLAVGTGIVALAAAPDTPILTAVMALAYVVVLAAWRLADRLTAFHALLAIVVIDGLAMAVVAA